MPAASCSAKMECCNISLVVIFSNSSKLELQCKWRLLAIWSPPALEKERMESVLVCKGRSHYLLLKRGEISWHLVKSSNNDFSSTSWIGTTPWWRAPCSSSENIVHALSKMLWNHPKVGTSCQREANVWWVGGCCRRGGRLCRSHTANTWIKTHSITALTRPKPWQLTFFAKFLDRSCNLITCDMLSDTRWGRKRGRRQAGE